MRLLRCRPDGTLELSDNVDQASAGSYAVLSHTWGPEEVTYEDFRNGLEHYKTKLGYVKLAFMASQTREAGLVYFWIDSVCIDKSNSSELSEAINSMFRWYRDALKCFVYLSDVSSKEDVTIGNTAPLSSSQHFEASRWFKRGWTLQELLAPGHVEFYNREGVMLGSKSTLEDTISSITKIPVGALRGQDLEHFSVAQRLSWASSRQTARHEDLSYCMLGIFNINIPLVYGEGRNAFRRLQEEIIKKGNDQSIFAWRADKRYGTHGLLASSPTAFANSHNVVPARKSKRTTPFAMTQLGLQIQLDMSRQRNGLYAAVLDCINQEIKQRIGVHLAPLGDGCYLRTRLDQFVTPEPRRLPYGSEGFKRRKIYVPQRTLAPLPGLRLALLSSRLGGTRLRSFHTYRWDSLRVAARKTCLRGPTRLSSLLRSGRFFSWKLPG